jgi:hypothetical protein
MPNLHKERVDTLPAQGSQRQRTIWAVSWEDALDIAARLKAIASR